MKLPAGKKIYFASDLHLGAPNPEKSLERERLFVQWLEEVRQDAAAIFIVGDLFDFWFEYKKAVPRGFVRVLGKIAELSDAGIDIHLFTGNHDMWIFDYLPNELNAKLYREPIAMELGQHRFYIGHGDGLGPGDHGYKFIKKIFSNPLCRWAFARLHPNFGIALADFFSKSSRAKTGEKDAKYLGEEGEWLVQYSKEVLEKESYDYLIFGHRHLPLRVALNDSAIYYNLGDWIRYNTYGVYDGRDFQLLQYPQKQAFDFSQIQG